MVSKKRKSTLLKRTHQQMILQYVAFTNYAYARSSYKFKQKKREAGLTGDRTRNLSHPKRESYH